MANPVLFPANLTWVGYAKEASNSYGVAIAAPAIWVPVMDAAHTPQQTQLEDVAMRGNMNELQGVVQGVRYDTLSYKTGLYIDSLFPHMMALLGAPDTMTGASDPYTHKTSVSNTSPAQPPSYTLFLYNGAECWQMPGAIASKSEVVIKATALGEHSLDWMGLPAVKMASPPSNTPTTVKPWPSWNTTITVNAVTATSYSDITLSYARKCKAIDTADGTLAPYAIFGGTVTGEVDLTGVYQGYAGTPTDMQNYLTNTQVPITVQINPASDAVHYGKWQHTLCAATTSAIKSAADTYVEIASHYKAIANTTDATSGGTSVGQFSLLTAVSTAY